MAVRGVQVSGLYESLYALRRGTVEQQAIAPNFYSTAGNRLGMEISSATQSAPSKTFFKQMFY
jgi:hypothetical protein